MKKNKIVQLKEFGIGLGVILIIIGFMPLLKRGQIRYWAIYASIAVLLLKFFLPRCLGPVYMVFIKITHVIGKINSVVLLSIIYYLLITPMGLIMRMLKQSTFKKGFDKTAQTYWIKRGVSFNDPKRMERQF